MSPRSTHQRMRKPPPRDESKWPYQRSVRCSSTHRSQRFSHCKQVNRKLLSAISAAFLPERREEHIVSRLLLQKVAKFRTSFVQRAFYPIPHRDRNHLQPHCVPRITWYTHQRTRRFVGLCSYRRWKHTNPTSWHLCALNKTTPANPEKTTTGGSRYSTRPLLRWLGGGRHGGVSQSPKPHQQTREPNFLCP